MGCRFAKFSRMNLSLFFGWRPSPAKWGAESTLLMQNISAHFPNNVHVGGPESSLSYQYVGDVAFIEPWLGVRPWQAISLWGDSLTRCLGPDAVHLHKRRVEGNAETTIALWGIIVSTADNTSTLPRGKIGRAKEFLMSPAFDPCVTRIPLKRLHELQGGTLGQLQYVIRS